MPTSAAEMEQDAQIVMRVPQEMADRLKEYSNRLSQEFGVPVSVAAAARRLLSEGLEKAGLPATTATAPADRAAAKKPTKSKSKR